MPAGFGVAPDAQGNGTTPTDIQAINGAMFYNPGIIDGGRVTGRANMAYDVSAGAVVVDTGGGLAIIVPISATTVTTAAAPATGSRTDKIYVKQNMPGADGTSSAVVGVTSGTVPVNSVVLDQRVVKAGTTSTSATSSNYDRRYARLIGSSLGVLSSSSDDDTTAHHVDTVVKRGTQRFYVPTDRKVSLRLTTTMSRSRQDGMPQQGNLRAVAELRLFLDNQLIRTHHREYSGFAAYTDQFSTDETVLAGDHTAHYEVAIYWLEDGIYRPNEYWRVRSGGTTKYHGSHLTVIDEGLAE